MHLDGYMIGDIPVVTFTKSALQNAIIGIYSCKPQGSESINEPIASVSLISWVLIPMQDMQDGPIPLLHSQTPLV
jgi:hypothetical protein